MKNLIFPVFVTALLWSNATFSGPSIEELANQTCADTQQHFADHNYGLAIKSQSGKVCYSYFIAFVEGAIFVDGLAGGEKLSQCKSKLNVVNVMQQFFQLAKASPDIKNQDATPSLGAALYFECDKILGVVGE